MITLPTSNPNETYAVNPTKIIALGLNYRPVWVEAVSISVLHRHRILENEPYIMEVDDNARVKVLFTDEETGSWIRHRHLASTPMQSASRNWASRAFSR